MSDPVTLAQLGPAALLALAVIALWRRDLCRDVERAAASKLRDDRIANLEAKQDDHANQYRILAEKMAEVVADNRNVMLRVLESMSPTPKNELSRNP